MMGTMREIRYEKFGGPEVLTLHEDAPEPVPGADVLIHGGSGGVGQLLVQIALQAGARRVWATGRAENAERIRALGAEPIPYDQVDWRETIQRATEGRGVDLVLDTHYFTAFEPSFDVLAEGGRIVVLPSLADLAPARERGVDARIPQIVPGRERLDRLVALQRSGHCDVEVSEVLPRASIAEGQRRLHEGHTRGKIVVDLRGGRGER